MTRRLRCALLVVALYPLAAACGGDEAVDPGEPVTAQTIRSVKTAFDVEAFAVPVGEEVTVTYDNAHAGVQHNVHFEVEVAGEEPETELREGPDVQEVTFAIDEAGEYDYICDLHPAQMVGTLYVE